MNRIPGTVRLQPRVCSAVLSYASFGLACRVGLGIMFGLSSLGKALDFARVSGLWARTLNLSLGYGRVLIQGTIILEAFYMVSLVFAVFSRRCWWVSLGLRAIAYTCAAFLAISIAFWTGLLGYEGCGCFGQFFEPGTTTHMVIRNALFLAMSIGARIE